LGENQERLYGHCCNSELFFKVFEHGGEAPLHPKDIQKMLRVRAIPDPAGCFASSGIEKGFGSKL